MQELTLEVLRNQNRAEEEAARVDSGKVETETEVDDLEQTETYVNDDTESDSQLEPGKAEDGKEEEVESWMSESDSGSDDGSKHEKTVALKDHIELRQSLKEKNREKNEEIESLRRELEELKRGSVSAQPVQSQQLKPRPKLEDFDYDEDQHNAALDDWYDERLNAKLQTQQQSVSQQEQQRQASEKLEQSVNEHYHRVNTLLSQNPKIQPEKYQDADLSFRRAVEDISPGNGDSIAETLISVMGEGSEKLIYNLGVNKGKMAEFKDVLRSDPRGLKVVAWLTEHKGAITQQAKRTSQAPKPARQVKGGGDGKSVVATDFKRKYDKAKTPQERYNIYRDAKKAGFNLHS